MSDHVREALTEVLRLARSLERDHLEGDKVVIHAGRIAFVAKQELKRLATGNVGVTVPDDPMEQWACQEVWK